MNYSSLLPIQTKILNKLLLALFLLSLPVISYIAYEEFNDQLFYRVLFIYLPLLFVLGVITFNKRLAKVLRSYAFVSLIMALATTELLYWGYASMAFFFFLAAVLFATLLESPSAGWISFNASLFIIIVMMILHSNQVLPNQSIKTAEKMFWTFWIGPFLSYMMIQVTVLITAEFLINSLITSLEENRENARQLRLEKEALEQTAYIDTVTGLPNNKKIAADNTKLMLEHAESPVTVDQILIEIENFEEYNIRYGIETGNRLLRAIGIRLAEISGCAIYRMNGAAFLINCLQRKELVDYSPIKEALSEPFSVDNQYLTIHFRGVHINYPRDISNPALILSSLMMNIYNDDTIPHNQIVSYNENQNQKLLRISNLKDKLSRALEFGEIQIMIQPRMNVRTGRIVGGELLMRWTNRNIGPVSPVEFIPISEKDEQIFHLTHYLMEQSLEIESLFKPDPEVKKTFSISVNISPNIIQAEKLHELHEYTQKIGSAFSYEFELTEGVFLGVNDRVIKEIKLLQNKGIATSIDDFGTGYSNLEYLQDLNINILKIDKKFIDGLPGNSKQQHLVRAVIQMAHALNLTTVAEGVEFMDQYNWLRKEGVDEIQGFVLSRPIRLVDLQDFYNRHDKEKWIV